MKGLVVNCDKCSSVMPEKFEVHHRFSDVSGLYVKRLFRGKFSYKDDDLATFRQAMKLTFGSWFCTLLISSSF